MVTKEEIDKYIKAYSEGKPLISDAEYDRLLEEYLNEVGEENRPFLRMKQSDQVQGLVKTLSKVYGVEIPMREGQKIYKSWVESKKYDPDTKIIIQPKFDGVSIAYDPLLNKYYTRGDYDNGESVDVTSLFVNYNNKTYHEAVDGVKYEGIMSTEVFDILFKDKYDTPRDVVSALITSRNVLKSKYITLIPLRESIGFEEFVCSKLCDVSIVSTTVYDYDTIQQYITDVLNDGAQVTFGVNNEHFAIDGVVVSIINESNEIIDEIAIKILNDVTQTKLIDIEWQFGVTGKITPVAILEPVKVAGGTRVVDHATLSTFERVMNMNLKYNDTVDIMYNIVPYFLRSHGDGSIPFKMPDKCMICSAPLDLSNPKTVRCTNNACDGRKKGSIVRYVKNMKMMGISDMTINTLYDNGLIHNIPDLYNLTVDDICKLDGFKETSATNIINSIRKASTDVPVSRWLGSLPFNDISNKTWDLILNTLIGRDEMKKSNFIIATINDGGEKFLQTIEHTYIRGVGPSTRVSLLAWYDYLPMMQSIIKNIVFKTTTPSNSNNTKGGVTFTGFRDAELANQLDELGYQVIDFSSKTKYLIIPNVKYSNAKTKKAERLGIEIIAKDDINKLM